MNFEYDITVIGGGPAGLAAAWSAKQKDSSLKVVILERDRQAGGILNQCIHNGFGLTYFKEELTGPEYADRFIKMACKSDVEIITDTMVLEIRENLETDCKILYAVGPKGLMEIHTKAIILAMGCRERTRGAINIPGDRGAGILTAGTAQYYINMKGLMPGKNVVILGSGDIGLIMARRLTLEGAKVLACVEISPYSGGLNRNIVQCLKDYNIPLYLSHTITEIKGKHRVEGIKVSKVNSEGKVVLQDSFYIECDTVLLSVGLVPENELTKNARIPLDNRTNGALVYENRETMVKGVFACGNVLHVHDLVDFVSSESIIAGNFAALYVLQKKNTEIKDTEIQSESVVCAIDAENKNFVKNVFASDKIRYTVPQKIRIKNIEKECEIFFRVVGVYKSADIVVKNGEETVLKVKRINLTPGEMQHIKILKEKLQGKENVYVELKNICEE